MTVIGTTPIPNGRLPWLRKMFPTSVFENRQSIAVVNEVIIRNNLAKVTLLHRNDDADGYIALPWVFMLTRSANSKWMIYDIQTPAWAKEYYP
jgi:hypothetical protein